MGVVLHLIKMWLGMSRGRNRPTGPGRRHYGARDDGEESRQGGGSPLFTTAERNLYDAPVFVLGWKKLGLSKVSATRPSPYADESLLILCGGAAGDGADTTCARFRRLS